MRTVGRLHEAADRIDPFRPAPLYAFSRLTAQAGLVLIGFNALGIFLNPAMFESSAVLSVFLPWLVGFTLVADRRLRRPAAGDAPPPRRGEGPSSRGSPRSGCRRSSPS